MANKGVQGSYPFCMAIGLPSGGKTSMIFLSLLVVANLRCIVVQYLYVLFRFVTQLDALSPLIGGFDIEGMF